MLVVVIPAIFLIIGYHQVTDNTPRRDALQSGDATTKYFAPLTCKINAANYTTGIIEVCDSYRCIDDRRRIQADGDVAGYRRRLQDASDEQSETCDNFECIYNNYCYDQYSVAYTSIPPTFSDSEVSQVALDKYQNSWFKRPRKNPQSCERLEAIAKPDENDLRILTKGSTVPCWQAKSEYYNLEIQYTEMPKWTTFCNHQFYSDEASCIMLDAFLEQEVISQIRIFTKKIDDGMLKLYITIPILGTVVLTLFLFKCRSLFQSCSKKTKNNRVNHPNIELVQIQLR